MFTTLLVQPLFNILFAAYSLVLDFGLAVIILTVIVRLLIWPLVTRQLHSQRVMQQLQPEVAKIREKTKGDRQKETEMLMELYREKGTSPFAPILPLLIQLPIFFALYIVLRDSVQVNEISKLAYDWVKQLGPVADIISGKVKFSPSLYGLVDLTKPSIVLAVMAGAAQYLQTKMLQPKNLAAAGDTAKIMSSMIVIFPVITAIISLTLPSALALYWVVTSLVAAFQQYWVLMRDAEEMEEMAEEIEEEQARAAKLKKAKKSKKARKRAAS